MTLHNYELPCFGVKFSNLYPASESGFLPRIFSGGIYCYANFSIVFKPIFRGGGKFLGANCLREKPAVSRTMYQNTEMSCFQRKCLQILVLYVIL